MDNTDYCSYELSVKLKELGFDLECYEFWSTDFCTDGTPVKIRQSQTQPKPCVMSERNSVLEKIGSDLITAPTLAKAQKWLMSKGIFVDVSCYGNRLLNPDGYSCKDVVEWAYELKCTRTGDYLNDDDYWYVDYNTCLSAGISAALELIGKEGK